MTSLDELQVEKKFRCTQQASRGGQMIEKSERNHQNPAVGPARASLLGLLEEHLAGALGDLAVLLVEHAERVLERLDLRLCWV